MTRAHTRVTPVNAQSTRGGGSRSKFRFLLFACLLVLVVVLVIVTCYNFRYLPCLRFCYNFRCHPCFRFRCNFRCLSCFRFWCNLQYLSCFRFWCNFRYLPYFRFWCGCFRFSLDRCGISRTSGSGVAKQLQLSPARPCLAHCTVEPRSPRSWIRTWSPSCIVFSCRLSWSRHGCSCSREFLPQTSV